MSSSISTESNGIDRRSNAEFIQFLYIAKGSAGEVRAQLFPAFDQRYVSEEQFKKGCALCRNVSAQLSSLIYYLKGSRMKGEKFEKEYKSMREEVERLTQKFNIQYSKFKENP